MLADTILTITGYYHFGNRNYNPYTMWIFKNLHWGIWVIIKLGIIISVYYLLKRLHWIPSTMTYIVIILIMLGAVLYDIDSIMTSNLYYPYLRFFAPVLRLPVIVKINNLLWGIYG